MTVVNNTGEVFALISRWRRRARVKHTTIDTHQQAPWQTSAATGAELEGSVVRRESVCRPESVFEA